ncbi:MAG: reprolysin-like metallopeptidase [Phycisphaerales bacterium]
MNHVASAWVSACLVAGSVAGQAGPGVVFQPAQVGVEAISPDGVFAVLSAMPAGEFDREPFVRPARFSPVMMDRDAARRALAGAPTEDAYLAGAEPLVMDLPMPDGSFEVFFVYETPMLAPELAAKFPDIRTYAGVGVTDAGSVARLTMTPLGFDAFVMRIGPDVFIDRFSLDNADVYTSYYGPDLQREHLEWTCGFDPDAVPQVGMRSRGEPLGRESAAVAAPVTLRTFQAAIAATGEYTQYFGGTVSAGLSAVVTAMNRVSGIYERDLAARFQLVGNNDLIIFTNPNSDPFSSSPSLSSIDSAIDSRIGSGNYDVGHLVDTGGGGYAFLGVVCTSSKGGGYTGLTPPTGDRFYVDYLAHELGHQFGGNHTFNGDSGSCSGGNRNGSTAYEPGSGTTIMAYAGICGNDNTQTFSDDYFHFISLQEMSSHIASRTCDQEAGTGNTTPDAGVQVSTILVPINTPFRLVGTGSDVNGDTLTYTWEQRDLGPQRDVSASDNGSSPIFRSFEGTTNPERVFPNLVDWRDGVLNRGEKLPTVARTLDFRLTVRDNNPAGGGYDFADAQVIVDASGGPFRVTSQSSPVTVTNGQLTVNWDVAGTSSFPFLASTVNIRFSQDGAQSFPHVLASGTPNDGSETVTLPSVLTTQGYIMVEASSGAFLDINKAPITVDVPPEPVVISFPNGLPTEFNEGEPTTILVDIDPGTNTLSPSALFMFYGFNTIAPFNQTSLVPLGGTQYEATIPGGACDDDVVYSFQVATTGGDLTYSPEPAGTSYSGVVVCQADCPPDINGNGVPDPGDFTAWVTAYNAGDLIADQNQNGVLDPGDFTAWVTNYNAGCP